MTTTKSWASLHKIEQKPNEILSANLKRFMKIKFQIKDYSSNRVLVTVMNNICHSGLQTLVSKRKLSS